MFNKRLIKLINKNKTPFYFYDTGLLHKTLFAIKEAANLYNYHIHYAIKANANPDLLRIISSYELGADCVSANEIKRALKTGFDKQKIVFAGVGKSDDEIEFAIENDIFCINCESTQELEVINEIAAQKSKKVRVALRLNPNVDAHTHAHITTGLSINKFGISEEDLRTIVNNLQLYPNVLIDGIHYHIGSQITDFSVFKQLCDVVNNTQDFFMQKGIQLNHINLGGGLGIDYEKPEGQVPDFRAYFSIFKKHLKVFDYQTIHFEPGRSVIGQCGFLISKVLYVKENQNRKTMILDAGFTELLRPALYQANHKIINISNLDEKEYCYDIAGPICETSDYFGKSIKLKESRRGDLMAILSAGAYGEVMASRYNLRETPNYFISHELQQVL